MTFQRVRHFVLFFALLLPVVWCRPAAAYSLLTHEQLIDLTWDDAIVPFLLSRYPNLTAAELDRARSYAYGGCVIQDVGYYPFGDVFFSDLTHYVRTGDFIIALLRNAHNADELAFAAGAMSHYIGDSFGHSQATNRAVSIEFPKLAARYGKSVNYAEGKHQHVQTEFAFDIYEIAHHRFAPLTYLRHIGINVPVHQLALAFYQTYGLTENFTGGRRTFNEDAYHFATRTFIPKVAYALTEIHHKQEPDEPGTADAQEIEKEAAVVAQTWAAYHSNGRGRFETHVLAFVIRVVPKVGPMALAGIKGPTAAAEADYMHSLVSATSNFKDRMDLFTPIADRRKAPAGVTIAPFALHAEDAVHPLVNRDLDTGLPVKPGGYRLTDATYAKLLDHLTRDPKQPIPPGIKEDVLAYYADLTAPIVTKKNPRKWAKVQDELKTLATMPTSAQAEPYPTYGRDVDQKQDSSPKQDTNPNTP